MRGAFNEFEGAFQVGEEGCARARHRPGRLDRHERGPARHAPALGGLLHAEVHPELSFESTEIRALDEDAFLVHGN